MCGIVGLYLKNQALQTQLGALFAPMLAMMSDRGPDSAGFAVYGNRVGPGSTKLSIRHDRANYDWQGLATALKNQFSGPVAFATRHSVSIFKLGFEHPELESFILHYDPSLSILSAGQSIEIYKAAGLPKNIIQDYDLAAMHGTHIVGHTRMATESAVTMAGSHPFSTGQDLCLVHNGSLSNHNRLRSYLQSQGVVFETENDSEVAAGYLTWRMQQGDSLTQALEQALVDLDGFYTFTIGTESGFAVLRDPIACKPAVMAETEDYVAMASEYRALSHLPGIENARVWEPEPAIVYVWER